MTGGDPDDHDVRRLSSVAILASQTRYQLRTYSRSPVAMFFSIGLPTGILLLLNAVLGNQTYDTPNGVLSTSQFYTGGLAAFTAVSVSYTGLVNIIPVRRDAGILKRWRTTPLPRWTYFGGWWLSTMVIAFAGVALQLTVGVLVYGVEVAPGNLPLMVVTFLVGVGCFCALGVAVAGLVPNAESAPAVANATILPLAFISDVFVNATAMPAWLQRISDFFPLRPFANAFQTLLTPSVEASQAWREISPQLLLLALWGVAGAAIAYRTFRWYPVRSSGRARRRGRAQPSA